jgi:hypothetical protein
MAGRNNRVSRLNIKTIIEKKEFFKNKINTSYKLNRIFWGKQPVLQRETGICF